MENHYIERHYKNTLILNQNDRKKGDVQIARRNFFCGLNIFFFHAEIIRFLFIFFYLVLLFHVIVP